MREKHAAGTPPSDGQPDGTRPFLPYGRQQIDEADIEAVVEVLQSDWLTTGPMVERFEQAFAARVQARSAVATSNGTTALHTAYHAAGIGEGDEVIVPAITFAATANAAVFLGARPVFVDVDPDTLLMDPRSVAQALGPRTRAIVPVDYAGQPCDYTEIHKIASEAGVFVVADACHSLGASWQGRPVGSLAHLNCFSFHPVKPITTGEGGMVTTEDPELEADMRRFRNHGLTSDHRQRAASGQFVYDMVELGWNHRLTDIQSALGLSQLRRLDAWTARRQEIAARYRRHLVDVAGIEPLALADGATHAYHLFVVRVTEEYGRSRDETLLALRKQGIGANVHYKPVHLHSYYRKQHGTTPGTCPVAEEAGDQVLSLPIFPAMQDQDVDRVIDALREIHEGRA